MSDQFEIEVGNNNQQFESRQPEAESREPNVQAESQEPEAKNAAASFHAARCQHIKVNGTQCGSPALKEKQFCYFHTQCRPVPLKSEGFLRDGEILLPAFEDATSIQFTLRQIMQLVLEKKMEERTARLLLYALQIASSNLKQMQAEKPRPTQVVVEPEKVSETPIGMTPWTSRRDRPEFDEEQWDVAAADYARKINERWHNEFRECKDLLAEKAAIMGRCLDEQPEAASEKLREALDKAKGSLERIVKIMEEHLGIFEIKACAEDEGYAPGQIQACAQGLEYVV